VRTRPQSPQQSRRFHASISATNTKAGGSEIRAQELFDAAGIESGEVISIAFQVLGLLTSAFGDGSDGDHVVVGTETLTRDTYYRNLTVPAATILQTAGFRVFVADTLTIEGTIRNNGAAGSNVAAPGDTGAGGTLGVGQGGGGTGAVGESSPNSLGGNGGNASGTGAVAAGTITRTTTGVAYVSLLPFVITGTDAAGAPINGGAQGGGATGASGGAGGGVVLIAAKAITGAGAIQANGGAGFASTGASGGGGGGFIVIAFGSSDETYTAAAAGGAGTGGSSPGAAGTVLKAHVVG